MYQLPNTQAAKANVAVFQLTATLPFTMEVVFLGGQSDVQKTIRGPATVCAGCAPDASSKPESRSDRLAALTGKPPCTCRLSSLWRATAAVQASSVVTYAGAHVALQLHVSFRVLHVIVLVCWPAAHMCESCVYQARDDRVKHTVIGELAWCRAKAEGASAESRGCL